MQQEYYDSKGKLVLLLVGAMAFVAAGAWMFIVNPDPGSGLTRLITFDGKLTQTWGAFAAVFFLACAVRAIQMLLDKSPRIVLSDAGVLDRTLSKETIVWSDIDGAEVKDLMNQKFICLFIKNPDKYAGQLSGPMKLSASGNKSLVGTPFVMNMAGLKATPEDICREICSRLK